MNETAPESPRPRLVVADDHALLSDLLAEALSAEGFDVATCHAPEAVRRHVGERGVPDLLLLDYDFPAPLKPEDVRDYVRLCQGAHVVIFAAHLGLPLVRELLQAGVKGYLPKTMSFPAFLQAIRLVLSGAAYIPEEVVKGQEGDGPVPHLTPTEREVLRHLVQGVSNKEIAAAMALSEPTVKMHLRSLTTKLGARNRTQLVLNAIACGLVAMPRRMPVDDPAGQDRAAGQSFGR